MKTNVRRFFKESNSKLKVLNLDGLRRDIDYNVVTETVFDYEGNEYLSLADLPESIRTEGNYINHPDLIGSKIALSFGSLIDHRCAKKCQLGVIEILEGLEMGKQYLFPVYEMDLEVQLMGYEVLTTGRVNRPFIKILQHPQHVKYIWMALGVAVFEEVAVILNLEQLEDVKDENKNQIY